MTLRKICELPKKCHDFVKVDDPNKKNTQTHTQMIVLKGR